MLNLLYVKKVVIIYDLFHLKNIFFIIMLTITITINHFLKVILY